MTAESDRDLLRQLFDAAVASADAKHCLSAFLPTTRTDRRVLFLGAGKAAGAMAQAVEAHFSAHDLGTPEGVVVTRYGHKLPTQSIEVLEAAHPVPDAAGAAAAARLLDCAQAAGADDIVYMLLSGGGSALLTRPAQGLTLAEKQAVNQALLASGATITEMNCIRKHLSAIKGGRLGQAIAPASIVNLIISDVPGDDPATIASGPTVADQSSLREARAIVDKYSLDLPPAVRARLNDPTAETPKPDDPAFPAIETHLIATPAMALQAAAKLARDNGIAVEILGDALEGESRMLAQEHAQLALRYRQAAQPTLLLSGGETTVTIAAQGRGGPNAEYALALAIALEGTAGISAIACDTDGIDGSEDNAGAIIDACTLQRGHDNGVNADEKLAVNDSYGFFSSIGDLVMSGPTLTNVNDFRAILINPAAS